MKKIWIALMATVSGLVLLFSYRTSLGEAVSASAAVQPKPSSTTSGSASGSTSGSASGSSAPATTSPVPSTAASGLATGTYLGDAVSTRYGDVQVRITVSGGVISAVDVPQYPNGGGRDQMINSQAIPQLVSETIGKTTANVDLVSGATYTSDGYEQSLQSAIDRARA
ncbi:MULTISPECIES: FMN-binding protein [unclassified Leucobacter]|uniref:FMN-binding protein n=1 Tax=unclassified Leucobacter TaxID=2621730 RepID=UPI0006215CC9|nr:FMN-binding protein [Leucobacter sp. Ag1]KKI19846.1 FMN-binding protein [Leucobacter sp. Ag1]